MNATLTAPDAASTDRRFPIPAEAGRGSEAKRLRVILGDAARGLYAQMYYWGVDVKHPEGNLLVAHGMTRIAKETAQGTSRYRQAWRGGMIELHGFCAGWYGPEGGIVFHRSRDTWLAWPGLEPPEPWCLDAARCERPHAVSSAEMLRRAAVLLEWVHGYESWAQRQWAGARERHHQAYLKLRPRRWWLPPAESLAWLRQCAAQPHQAPRPKRLLARTAENCRSRK